MWPLSTAKRAIIWGGCCAMAYTQLTTSPATVQFARTMGATGLHIGILGAIPVGVVFTQLMAAVVVNRLQYRKPLWFWLSLVQRVIFLPAALGPWLLPEVSDAVWIWTLIGLTAVNHSMIQFGTPLWLSWMGDYLPHEGLNEFWGLRHSAMQWTASLALLGNSLLYFKSGIDVRQAFAAIIVLGAVFGLADILLFVRVHEPPVHHGPEPRLWDVMAAPFREPNYRRFIWFSCFWHMASMVGAPFISMYLLEHVGMDLFHVLLLWTISWTGGAVLSRGLGIWTERFGHRPMLVLCIAFKSSLMLALLACLPDATFAFWALAPVLMFDAFLNAGITIANTGFMIKNSPRENRTMFVAAGAGFAGMVGGLTSIAAGALIAASDGWAVRYGSAVFVNFHVMFAVSIVLRWIAAVLALSIREPHACGTRHVIGELAASVRSRLPGFAAQVARVEQRDRLAASSSAAESPVVAGRLPLEPMLPADASERKAA